MKKVETKLGTIYVRRLKKGYQVYDSDKKQMLCDLQQSELQMFEDDLNKWDCSNQLEYVWLECSMWATDIKTIIEDCKGHYDFNDSEPPSDEMIVNQINRIGQMYFLLEYAQF